MAKPRIFVSSTFYDLQHIRENLESFIASFGFEPVLFESGDIPFTPGTELDHSCYREIPNCSMLILIIGSRYGSPASGENRQDSEDQYEFYNSVTKKEIETAHSEGIPCYLFVNQNVLTEYETYKRNLDKKDVHYAHVDNISIFKLVTELYATGTDHISGFTRFEHISDWLRTQWASEFEEYLSDLRAKKKSDKLTSSIEKLEGEVELLSNITMQLADATIEDQSALAEFKRNRETSQRIALLTQLKEIPYNGHLVYRHNYEIEKIEQAHKDSNSLVELETNLRKIDETCRCGTLSLSKGRGYYEFEEINRTRDLLGLNLFSSAELSRSSDDA